MRDDQVKGEDGRDVAEDEIVLGIDDPFLLGVEVLRAEKAGALLNGDGVDTGRDAGHSVGSVPAENPAPFQLDSASLGSLHGFMASTKSGPTPPLVLVESPQSRRKARVSASGEKGAEIRFVDDSLLPHGSPT